MKVFSIKHKRLKLRVQFLPTIADVDARFQQGWKHHAGRQVHAYFQPATSAGALHIGTIVLPMDGRLEELVPHEVTHAVIHFMRGVSANDDEEAATAVGLLSAKIFNHVKKRPCLTSRCQK